MAKREGVAWNKTKIKSVVLSKLKEFSIDEDFSMANGPKWSVRGWFNKDNYFFFGSFESEADARIFLEQIHSMY